MWRCCVIALVTMLAALALGCPKPISDEGTVEDQLRRAADDLAAESADDASVLVPAAADSENGTDEAAVPDAESTPAEPTEPGAEDGAAGAAEEEPDAGSPATDGTGPETGGQEQAVSDKQDFDKWDPQAALDPDRILTEVPAATSERPLPSVTSEAAAFAGHWDVAALNKDGRATLTETHNAWSFLLNEDGSCTVQQHANGEVWEQDGSWELAEDALTLALGPAGHRAYLVEQFSDNFAVLTDQTTSAALFCVRIVEGIAAPRVSKRYGTDFGELRLRASGQSYWRGTYGEPEGELLLRKQAGFLVGTWEQGADKGFVVFEIGAEGLAGWWWYEASTTVDGEWRGRVGE